MGKPISGNVKKSIMINLNEELKKFYISLRTIGFRHAYLTGDDNLFIKAIIFNNNIATYEITLHKKPRGYSLVFLFNGVIEFRMLDKSIPVFVEKMGLFIEKLYSEHEELLTF